MLSNKWTFSLTSLVVLIAFGLVCAVPSVFADGDANVNHYDIGVTIAAGETMVDVSEKTGFQIATGRDRADRDLEGGPASIITLTFTFSKGTINLHTPVPVPAGATAGEDDRTLKSSNDAFGFDDVFVEAFDKKGRSLGAFSVAEVVDLAEVGEDDAPALTAFQDANAIGRAFLLRIDESQILDAYAATRGGSFEIYRLSFFMPRAIPAKAGTRRVVATPGYGVKNLALDHFAVSFDSSADSDEDNSHAHYNSASNVFSIDLVDDDEGNPMYSAITSNTAATAVVADADPGGIPGVVSITRILDRNAFQPIESGPFNVRIILTEEPKGGLTTDLVDVVNGKATAFTKGLSLKGAITASAPAGIARTSELTPLIVNYSTMADADVLAEQAGLPEATGRDNEYHQYVATITPNAGLAAGSEVTVSIKQFADNVLPVPNMYVPLTASQRNATILTGTALIARDARLKNETVTVRVSTGAHQDRVDLMAAWKERRDLVDDPRTGIFNLSPHVQEIVGGDHRDLGGFDKLIIPADGYLVLARGSGIVNSPRALKLKLTEEQEKYNIIGFAPPRPASNLETFFRNGGTLHLLHSDLPLSTTAVDEEGDQIIGPSHTKGDAGEKEADTEHKDYTGYDGADSTAYTEGSLIVSEVMWGLDYISVGSQYIELYNPGTEAIELDPLEWVIVAGSVPSNLSDFTVIDTIGNNPSSGYWQVPGSSGVTGAIGAAELAEGQPIPVVARGDLVSMSRVTDGAGLAADGTAQASWATSMRPSANLSGRRIGTPGAANIYVPATVEEEDEEDEAPMADAAEAADIMITEIMVASNDGRLPQWIELANVSAATVSLSGWSLEIENDAADADVVGESIEIDLGDTEIGAGEVALVISKEGRNSGVDTAGVARVKGDANAGNLDADRIIDVKSQVSPTNARYSLISEMGFMISLLPPQTGAVRTPGDVAGNLGGGWELPMSEGGRSSLIRREMGDKGAFMGTDAAGWMLASDTMLSGAYRTTYYGSDEDVGTPGYDAGDALPVELSGFNAARDKVTGAVVITWATQSELNNAGFFIKRSQQTKGKFVIVNPTMIAGAGTTAEKQSYTYTDATADPNVIYFYQIEDVSLDGNRQTLTRAHRLKGHIGAAGKATTTWGELKSSRE